ncbi:hypothetical protein LINPERPRIM_LOCUS7507 [Linum perenne]
MSLWVRRGKLMMKVCLHQVIVLHGLTEHVESVIPVLNLTLLPTIFFLLIQQPYLPTLS